MNTGLLRHAVATVLTVYGIETLYKNWLNSNARVATVLTVYGIETVRCHNYAQLTYWQLQQCLPFTVLKPSPILIIESIRATVATVLTVYGIETLISISLTLGDDSCCNSAYRLRY